MIGIEQELAAMDAALAQIAALRDKIDVCGNVEERERLMRERADLIGRVNGLLGSGCLNQDL